MEILNAMRIAAIAGLAVAGCAHAGVPGAVFEHGDIAAGSPGDPVAVHSGLLQVELAPGVVASASGGTTLQWMPRASTPGIDLTVLQGSVRLIQTRDGKLSILGPGRYRMLVGETLSIVPLTGEVSEDASRLLDADYRQRVNLADSILLQQDKKLQVDTRSFVQQIFRIFGR